MILIREKTINYSFALCNNIFSFIKHIFKVQVGNSMNNIVEFIEKYELLMLKLTKKLGLSKNIIEFSDKLVVRAYDIK